MVLNEKMIKPWNPGKAPFLILIALILGVLLSGCGGRDRAQEGTVSLKWKVKKGDTHNLFISTRRVATITIRDKEESVFQSLNILYHFLVEDISRNSDVRTRITLEGVSAEEKSLLGEFLYHSDNPPEENSAELGRFAALAGKSFALTASPKWEVIKVEGLEEIEESIRNTEPAKHEMGDTNLSLILSDDASANAVLETLELVFSVFPGRVVNTGGSWNRELTSAAHFPCIVRSLYTLEKTEKGEALLSILKTISPNTEDPDVLIFGMRAYVNGSGRGALRLDAATGWPLKGAIWEKVEGSLKSPLLSVVSESNEGGFPISMETKIIFQSPEYKPKEDLGGESNE